ncbi:MAG TPA: DUF5947 family protein [Thermomicrobiales bacterium]|nr:DUF5947 family protein [Thermomicrobiales bacterium]
MVGRDVGGGFAALRRFAERATPPAATADAAERCDFCGEPLPPEHRHLLEVATRQARCVCRACALLFDNEAASDGRYRLIPDRRLYLADFRLDDAEWAGLQIPVGLAFFCESTPAGRMLAYYPGPLGPTESLLPLDTWADLAADNPVLAGLRPDVEALLVNRARGAREHYLVPIDECYRLVGVIRLNWRGLGGGREVWDELGRFFAALRARCATVVNIVNEETGDGEAR